MILQKINTYFAKRPIVWCFRVIFLPICGLKREFHPTAKTPYIAAFYKALTEASFYITNSSCEPLGFCGSCYTTYMETHTKSQSTGGQNFWNFIFSIFFIGVLVGALWLMKSVRGGYLISVPPFDALLMALAAFRITRLVVYDKISLWFRDLFKDAQGGIMLTVKDLLSCPWCIGFWSALVIVVAYYIFPWAWSVIFFLAIAGLGSFFQLIANAVGWYAENKKLDAYEKEHNMKREIDRMSLGK